VRFSNDWPKYRSIEGSNKRSMVKKKAYFIQFRFYEYFSLDKRLIIDSFTDFEVAEY
jgi:hypothetical protein